MKGLYVCPACRAVCEYEGEFEDEWSCPRCGKPWSRARDEMFEPNEEASE